MLGLVVYVRYGTVCVEDTKFDQLLHAYTMQGFEGIFVCLFGGRGLPLPQAMPN